MRLLLSIKPQYAEQILAGTKRYEYRRVRIRRPVTRVLLYATLPVGKVVGECRVDAILTDTVPRLWERTARLGGLSHSDYVEYFRCATYAVALHVSDPIRYHEPLALDQVGHAGAPPQSFCYLE